MWEAINPDVFLVASTENGLASGTFTNPIDKALTVNTSLSPFTSADVQTPYTSTTSHSPLPAALWEFLPRSPEMAAFYSSRSRRQRHCRNQHTVQPQRHVRLPAISTFPLDSRSSNRSSKRMVTHHPSFKHSAQQPLHRLHLARHRQHRRDARPAPASIHLRPAGIKHEPRYRYQRRVEDCGRDTEDVDAVAVVLTEGLSWSVLKGDGGPTVESGEVEGLKVGLLSMLYFVGVAEVWELN